MTSGTDYITLDKGDISSLSTFLVFGGERTTKVQFNSYLFILAFLPIFLITYFVGNKINKKCGRWLIIIAGLIFYYFAGRESFKIFLISAVVNFILALILKRVHKGTKILLFITIAANIGLLLYYKYVSFIIATTPSDPATATTSTVVQDFVMPLGISFFTFQQIMYVVGVYRGEIEKTNILDYAAYITYFPKLLMGPMVEPVDLLAQINNPELKKINFDNLAIGLKLFSFGLFKKLVLADTFTRGVEWGFSNIEASTAADMILTMLFYTFEIYFDFSGYTDMATGISKMINIDLPINFESPYKATSIREFWKRWHISLTKFFTKYVYFPLGGSKKGNIRTYVNIMIVFLVSGLWHGANFTFILWGAIHGFLQVMERLFDKYFKKLSEIVRWIYTFAAVNVLWLLFRAESITQWHSILYKILTFQSTAISDGMINSFILPETPLLFRLLYLTETGGIVRGFSLLLFTVTAFVICLIPENNYKSQGRRNVVNMIMAAAAFVWGFLCLSSESVFVYFNF